MTATPRRRLVLVFGLLMLAAVNYAARASSIPAGFADTPISRPDGHPWEEASGVTFSGDGRMFVWERSGRIWVVDDEHVRSTPLIDLSDEVSSIGSLGLTGFALDPDFDRNGYVYLLYAVDPRYLAECDSPTSGPPVCRADRQPGAHAASGATIGRLARYQLTRAASAPGLNTAYSLNSASRRILLGETPENTGFPTGCVVTDSAQGTGGLAFGTDGTLLVSCGDGAALSTEDAGSNPNTHYGEALAKRLMTSAENVGAFRAQLIESLSGKILRIDPSTGNGVQTNPFYDSGSPRAARSRVWILGLHDPRSFAVRPGTGSRRGAGANPGTLYIGEVGHAAWESLAVATTGGTNFGWPLYEGVGDDATPYGGLSAFKLVTSARKRPAIDWSHAADVARWSAFDASSEPLALNIGSRAANGAIVTGAQFHGTASIGGVWYSGVNYPAPFQNVYFHADTGGEWIKAFDFDSSESPIAVHDFLNQGGAIRALAENPRTGNLYYVTGPLGSEVRSLTYSQGAVATQSAIASTSSSSHTETQPKALSPSGSKAVASTTSRALKTKAGTAAALAIAPNATPAWSNSDIGTVGAAGSFTLNAGTFTVKGSGTDIWNTADAFQFVYQPLSGDGSITARVVSQTNTNAWAKAGVMFRGSLSANSINAFVGITPVNGSVIQARASAGASSVGSVAAKVAAPYWVRLVRAGTTFTASISSNGTSWSTIGQETVSMPSQVQVGLAVTSHANGTLGSVVFDNVVVTSASQPPDTQAPTVPIGLTASAVTASSLTLGWNASTDLPNPGGSGIGGYYVYRNGNMTTPVATVTSGTSFNETGLAPGTVYQYQVAAFDRATPVNVSSPSSALSVTTQNAPPPVWSNSDIGTVGAAGSFTLNAGKFTVKGSGADIWNTADAFQFVYQPLSGDGSITARVVSQTNTSAWAKAGVMFRSSLSANSINSFVGITPVNGSVIQARASAGGSSVGAHSTGVAAPYWVRLVRAGTTFTAYISSNGTSWSTIGQETVSMPSQVQVGLAVTSHASGTLGTVVFDNVVVTVANQNSITLTPHRVALTLSQTQQFTATTAGGASVNWTVDGIAGGNSAVGVISSSGLYQPPSTAGAHTIVATNAASPGNSDSAQVAVTDLDGVYTYHENNARTGVNTHEYLLTPASVSSANFGKRWSCSLDGAVWAQPLYAANLTIGGGVHNVVFVVTEHDSVYALDADSPACVTYWRVSLLSPGATPIPVADTGCNNIPVEIGVTGTPVIDPAAQKLYVVAATKENGNHFQRLHAIQLATGMEATGSPVEIEASIMNASGAADIFSPLWENQRPGLALSQGSVYISWASHCDDGTWWGWLMRYDARSLAQMAVFNVAPDGIRGGIWMSGGAPAVDSTGNLYFSTGNGTFDDTSSTVPPVPPHSDFGESFLKLDPASLAVRDFYSPSKEAAWSDADLDISSGGVTVLPDGAGPSAHPNVLIGADKQGHLWMLDRNQMKRFSSTSDNVVQFLTLSATPNCTEADEHCVYVTPAYWNGTVYISISSGTILSLPLSNGLMPATAQNVVSPASHSKETYNFPSPTPVISASPTGNGILWALDNVANGSGGVAKGPAILRAYDATDLGTTLYSSSAQKADAGGIAVKFTTPIVANGHVYVGGNGQLTVYGLVP